MKKYMRMFVGVLLFSVAGAYAMEPRIDMDQMKYFLFRATQEQNIVAMDAMLMAGVAVDSRDEDGRSPLMRAVEKGLDRSVRHLLTRRANPSARSLGTPSKSVLSLAVISNNPKMVRLLLAPSWHGVKTVQCADINDCDSDGRTALHWAALHGHHECVQVLLCKGSFVEKDDQGSTPYDLAFRMENTEADYTKTISYLQPYKDDSMFAEDDESRAH